tara:strand:+ start:13 stop:195 length:183 start_codon:yes stop_codon:yes gene_type:complete
MDEKTEQFENAVKGFLSVASQLVLRIDEFGYAPAFTQEVKDRYAQLLDAGSAYEAAKAGE